MGNIQRPFFFSHAVRTDLTSEVAQIFPLLSISNVFVDAIPFAVLIAVRRLVHRRTEHLHSQRIFVECGDRIDLIRLQRPIAYGE